MEGDRQKSRKKPELKIVEEETIHRLETEDQQGNAPRKKSTLRRSKEEVAMLRDLAGDNLPVAAPAAEEVIVEPGSPADPIRIPPALFVLAGAGFVLLLGLGIFLSLGGRNRDRLESQQIAARESLRTTEQELEEARAIVKSLTTALEKYTTATTIEEKLEVARHPDRVAPFMRDFYSKHEMEPLSGVTLTSQYTLPIESRSFVVLTGSFPDGNNRVYLAEVDNDRKVTIDWESDVCYQPVDLTEFIERKETKPTDLRVFANPDNFYVYEFSDSEKYQCLKLTFRDSDEFLFGYIERDNPDHNRLFKQFQASRSTGSIRPEPLLVSVRFLEGGRSERGVLIEEYIAPRWAYIDEFEDEE